MQTLTDWTANEAEYNRAVEVEWQLYRAKVEPLEPTEAARRTARHEFAEAVAALQAKHNIDPYTCRERKPDWRGLVENSFRGRENAR